MIQKNTDIKAWNTGLSQLDIHEAIDGCKKMRQIAELGERYLLHPANAPTKGEYDRRGFRVA